MSKDLPAPPPSATRKPGAPVPAQAPKPAPDLLSPENFKTLSVEEMFRHYTIAFARVEECKEGNSRLIAENEKVAQENKRLRESNPYSNAIRGSLEKVGSVLNNEPERWQKKTIRWALYLLAAAVLAVLAWIGTSVWHDWKGEATAAEKTTKEAMAPATSPVPNRQITNLEEDKEKLLREKLELKKERDGLQKTIDKLQREVDETLGKLKASQEQFRNLRSEFSRFAGLYNAALPGITAIELCRKVAKQEGLLRDEEPLVGTFLVKFGPETIQVTSFSGDFPEQE